MTADDLIAALSRLTPAQRQWPLVGHDGRSLGELLAIRPERLRTEAGTCRVCFYLVVRPFATFEWIERWPR